MSEAIPRLHQYKPLKEIKSLDEAVDHPEVIKRFQNALGDRLDAVQYLATIRNLTREDELFKLADLWELIRCALDLAELGLRPNTPFGHAWIIPRIKNKGKANEKVTLDPQIGYQGMLTLAYRADTLESIHADVVYEGDLFEAEYGSDAHLKHISRGSRRGRTPEKAYCHAKLKGGGQAFVYWDYADILEIRNDSEAYKFAYSMRDKMSYIWDKCVWVKFEYAMARKTIMKQLLKDLPKSSEQLYHAAYIDNLAEAGRLSYGGAAGDLRLGNRELTYSPGATLHDFGFKPPVVDVQAEKVASKNPASQASGNAQQGAKAPAKHESARTTAPARDPSSQHEPPKDRFPDEEDRQTFQLISADGEVLLDAINIVDWAKEFADHFRDVPPDMINAYNEHNSDHILTAMEDPDTTKIMAALGYGGQGQAQHASDDNQGAEASRSDKWEAKVVELPTGRTNEAEIITTFRQALAEIKTPEQMAEWRRVNQEVLNGMLTKPKILAYKEISARSQALGIPAPG
jgi:recombination protein RecT